MNKNINESDFVLNFEILYHLKKIIKLSKSQLLKMIKYF